MDEENQIWTFLLLLMIFSGEDVKFPPPPEYMDEDKALDEEYAKKGACERAIKQNRYTLQHGGHPMIKKESSEVHCHGYIYSMNDCVCRKCEACKIQYGHPFDPYWNDKESFVEYDEQSKRIQNLISDTCSIGYKDFQEKGDSKTLMD